MAIRRALVRRLPSVETLGSVTVICTDKTGTLTTGKMRIREIWGDDHRATLLTAASCCDSELGEDAGEGMGDPTELAILIAAREQGIERADIERNRPRLSTEPFDPVRRRMSVYRSDHVLSVKGAVEGLLPLCTKTPEEQLRRARSTADEFAARGLRVLAVATGTAPRESELTLLGLLGIADPPRTEAMDAIAEARSAGVTPVMITGDHPVTAAAIARELGLVLEGEALHERVHARATPEDKLRIIRDWKARGAVVAMTGDGVNDAPALREAHIGIAMGRAGTEVTRQSADLILADDNFATIVEAIREGRAVYQSIRKAVQYLLTGNLAELVAVLLASALMLPVPFLAAHLLWINLVTDALPGLALIAEPPSPDLMSSPPRPRHEKLLGGKEWARIATIGLLEGAVVVLLFALQLRIHGLEQARNVAFTTLVFSQIFRSLAARSRSRTFWQVGALSNLWLLGVAAITLFLQISIHFVPLTQKAFGLLPLQSEDFAWILPFALVTTTLIELRKLVTGHFGRLRDRRLAN
jgi:Ca2+-transporting ATPase